MRDLNQLEGSWTAFFYPIHDYRRHAFISVFFKRQINKFKLKTIIKFAIWKFSGTFQSENFKADVVLDQLFNRMTWPLKVRLSQTKNNHIKHNLWIWTQKLLEDVVRVSVKLWRVCTVLQFLKPKCPADNGPHGIQRNSSLIWHFDWLIIFPGAWKGG